MSPTPARSGAELLVAALVDHGIETVFGVPGDTGVVLYDVLRRRRDEVRHVLARDERHAAYMADAHARSSRRLAACEASSGAGAVYLAGGLAEAYAARIPILVITTDIQRGSRGSGAITEIDQDALFHGVTTWRRVVDAADDIPAAVAQAVAAATGTRPGPAVVVLPEDVLEQHGSPPAQAPAPASIPAARTAAPADAVRAAAAVLAAADAPVVLAGGGVHLSGAWDALARLAEYAAIPVATTIHGKGAIAEDHPLALGVSGGNGSRGYATDHVAAADAVLVVGSRANATDTHGFRAPSRDHPAVVRVDVDPDRAAATFAHGTALAGDAATVLDQLTAALPPAAEETGRRRRAAVEADRRRWARGEESAPDPAAGLGPGVLAPRDVVTTLRDVLSPETAVTADPGTPTPHLAAHWDTVGTDWRVMIPRGHGAMGYALPAAIGVAVAHPGRRVLCLTTESSVAMAAGDGETAVRLALPVVFVVLDNGSFAWIKMLQHLFFEGRYFGVEPGPIDPVLVGRGMGLPAARATDLDDLARLTKEAADRPGPSLIHVRVPEHAELPPPVAPWQSALAGEGGRPVY